MSGWSFKYSAITGAASTCAKANRTSANCSKYSFYSTAQVIPEIPFVFICHISYQETHRECKDPAIVHPDDPLISGCKCTDRKDQHIHSKKYCCFKNFSFLYRFNDVTDISDRCHHPQKYCGTCHIFVNTDCINQCVNETCRRRFFKNPRIFFLLLFFSFLSLRFLLLVTDCKILIHFHAPFLFQ